MSIKKIIPNRIKKVLKKLLYFYRRKKFKYCYSRNIKKYKNKYNGKRCFIIGNGPSLRIDDLEKLSDEITFASHFIYKTFDKTDWRPTFYCVEDIRLLNDNVTDIMKFENDYCHGFFTGNNYNNLPKVFLKSRKNDFWYIDKMIWKNNEPEFSLDADKYIAEGFTVTYAAIQLAVYMGFNEIYLLGVDHFYEKGNDYSNVIGEEVVYNTPQLDKSTVSYLKAKKVCEEKGIKIVNLTRGGHLEVFNRECFDDVIGEVGN